jgi:flagellar biogenesis protein FliO
LGSSYNATQGGAPTPTPADQAKAKEPVANVSTWDFINMILGLLIVVGIIYLIFRILKRGVGIITGSKALHIVEVGGSIYLVGSANDSINLISEVTEKEAKDSIRLTAAQKLQQQRPRFINIITSFFKPSVKKQLEINESIDFMKKQRSRLKKLKE